MAGGTKEQQREAVRRYRAAHPAATKEWNRRNPEAVLFKSIKSNAKARGRVCELTLEDVKRLTAPMECVVTGKPLKWGSHDWAPSIDRIESSEGYTLSNVRLVAWIFNRARGVSSDKAVLEMAQALVQRADKKETDHG